MRGNPHGLINGNETPDETGEPHSGGACWYGMHAADQAASDSFDPSKETEDMIPKTAGVPGAQMALFVKTNAPRLFNVAEPMRPRGRVLKVREETETRSPLDVLLVKQEPSLPGQMTIESEVNDADLL